MSGKHAMNWQDTQRDPFLAGSIAARGVEWWEPDTAEENADSVGLVGEAREKFIQAWNEEIAEAAAERKEQQEIHIEQGRGDPADEEYDWGEETG